ncbi:MAG: TIGR03013 family XrtA/PEP-CTERM system glycosyltransferase [Planctomycetota bacterium]
MKTSPRKLVLVLGETAVLFLTVFVITSYGIVTQILTQGHLQNIDPNAVFNGIVTTLVITTICQICFFFNDLYDWRVLSNSSQTAIHLLQSVAYTVILLAVLYYVFMGLQRLTDYPLQRRFAANPIVVVIALSLVYPLCYYYRLLFHWTVYRWVPKDRLIFIGASPMSAILEKELAERKDPGYVVVGYILEHETATEHVPERRRVLGSFKDITTTARHEHASRLIVTLPERRGSLPMLELLNCRLAAIRIEEGEIFYERLTGKIAVERLRPSYLIFSEGFNRSKFNYIFKRLMDVSAAAFGLIVSAPIALLAAVAIKLDSPGPILFRQKRVGKEGRVFTLLKFRSMRSDAEKTTGPVWASEDDQRVTRVGRVIRRLRIDEIPQMVNVLRNEMSFVGPRPERPFFVEELKREIPYYTERLVVKPGITGWAQINYRYGSTKDDAIQKLQYDLYYIKNMSIFLDIIIILRTIKVIVLRRGAI